MPANRLAASKASYPMATAKIKMIQSTPPPRPSCLLVVIEAGGTLQLRSVFLAPAEEAGGLGLELQVAHRSYSPVHTPAHEIIYALCYGNRMGPEYDLGARPRARIRRMPRSAPYVVAGAYKTFRTAKLAPSRLPSTPYKQALRRQRDSRNPSRMSGLCFFTRYKSTFLLDTNGDFSQLAVQAKA